MTMSPCLTCGEPCTGPRCAEHTVEAKGSAEARGYDAAWRRLSKRARRMQPWCETCGAVDDLTADHSPEAWAAKAANKPIKLSMLTVLCRPCNSRKGAAR